MNLESSAGRGHARHPLITRSTESCWIMELTPLGMFTVKLAKDEIFNVGKGPAGRRIVFGVESGTWEGDRINATVKGSATADWSTTDANGTMTADVRALIETDDGALIYLAYAGRADFSGGPGTAPLFCGLVFETGSEEYLWLNSTVAVMKGSFPDPLTISYEVCALA